MNDESESCKMIVVVMGVCGSGKTSVGSCVAGNLGWSFTDADEFHSVENKIKMSAGVPLTDQDRLPWLLSIHSYVKRLSQDNQSGVVTCSALKAIYRDVLRTGENQVLNCEPDHNSATSNDEERNLCQRTPDTSSATCTSGSINVTETSNKSTPNRLETLQNKDPKKQSISDKHEYVESAIDIHFVHLTGSIDILTSRMMNRLGHFMPAALLQSQLNTLESLQEHETGFTVDIDASLDDVTKEIIRNLAV